MRRVRYRPFTLTKLPQNGIQGRNAPFASSGQHPIVSGALRPKGIVCEGLRQVMGRECTLQLVLPQKGKTLNHKNRGYLPSSEGCPEGGVGQTCQQKSLNYRS
jgi:hypothetical protein